MFEGILHFVNLRSEMGITGIIGFKVPDNSGVSTVLSEELNKCLKSYHGWCQITLQPPYKNRTTGPGSQSNKYHGICRQIIKATGNDMRTIKRRCVQVAVEYYDYPCDEVEDINGNTCLVPWAEERCNTVQYAGLIKAAEYVAANDAEIILKNC